MAEPFVCTATGCSARLRGGRTACYTGCMRTGTEHLIVQREGPIGMLIINRPERHNAVSLEAWRALPEILDALAADVAMRVLLLRGAGGRS